MSLSPRAKKTRDDLRLFTKDLLAVSRAQVHCDLDNPTNNSPQYSPMNAHSPTSPTQRKIQLSPRVAINERMNEFKSNSPKSPLFLTQTMKSQSTRSAFKSESFAHDNGLNMTLNSNISTNTVFETEFSLLQNDLSDTKDKLESEKEKNKNLLADYQHQSEINDKMKEANSYYEKKYDELKVENEKLNYKTRSLKDELDL